MKLSLVTGKVERHSEFQRLVDSIFRHTTIGRWELVVSDASEEPYQPQAANIRVLHEKPRQTHSRGYNRAFRVARGEYILWLNDDATVCSGYDVAAIEFMETHPHIGLGALYYSEDGSPFHVNSAWQTIYANFGIFKKSLGERVGYFDEGIKMYGADNSLAFRILLQGFGVAGIPEARIIHHSTKDQIRVENQATRSEDNAYLQRVYMPLKRHWQETFRKHCSIVDTTEVWPHGRQEIRL